jgi:hypothetical protein
VKRSRNQKPGDISKQNIGVATTFKAMDTNSELIDKVKQYISREGTQDMQERK